MENDLNTEVDLVAFISLLSALICSLLLTAVWVHLGTIDVKQAMGGQAVESKAAEASLLVRMNKSGALQVSLQDAPKGVGRLSSLKLSGVEGRVNLTEFAAYVEKVKAKIPNINMALIEPKKDVIYEEIIALMDEFKKLEVDDLGIVPY